MGLFTRLEDCTTEGAKAALDRAIRENLGHVNILVDTGFLFESDLPLFFGSCISDEVWLVVKPDATWAHILVVLRCFPSVSQARKNGWNKEVQPGFTFTFKVGKANRKFITAFRPTAELEAQAPGSGELLKF